LLEIAREEEPGLDGARESYGQVVRHAMHLLDTIELADNVVGGRVNKRHPNIGE